MRNRLALSITAAASFAACGGPQMPVAPGAIVQKSPIATQAGRDAFGPLWLRRGTKHDDLLYLTESGVKVFTYPQGKIVGDLSGVGGATDGECVDKRGNVFVTDQLYSRLDKFAHGRVGKIGELHTHRVAPISCSIDPISGDLAATGFGNKVNIFRDAQGKPETLTASKSYFLFFCAYDSHGNLFILGEIEKRYVPILLELPAGSHKFVAITFDKPLEKRLELSGVQWDGKYVVVGAYKNERSDRFAKLYRYAINGTQAQEVGTVVLKPAQEFFQFEILGDVLIVPNQYLVSRSRFVGSVMIYKYPAGGKPTETMTKHVGGSPRGVVVSPAQ